MPHEAEKIIDDIIYISYRNMDLQNFVKNISIFMSWHMPVNAVALCEFSPNTIIKLAEYTCNEEIFAIPDKIDIGEEGIKEVLRDAGDVTGWHAPRICRSNDGHAYCKFYNKIHREHGESIFLPLYSENFFSIVRYIAIFSKGKNSYTEQHLSLCERLRRPLRAALMDIVHREKSTVPSADIRVSLKEYPTLPQEQSELDKDMRFEPLHKHIAWYITKVIQHTNGRISGPKGAAEILEIPATTLWSKMRKLQIKYKKILELP